MYKGLHVREPVILVRY